MMQDEEPVPFDRSMSAGADAMAAVSPLVRRLVARNAGPFTFTGTCTYVVGHGTVAVIDPGPADPHHLRDLLDALGPERVAAILVTHTHRDHSPGAAALKAMTGAPVLGCAPYRPATSPPGGDLRPADASNDLAYAPDRVLGEDEAVEGDGFTLRAVATPGHAANHLAFALPEEDALFSGDHVMAWSTTVVAPPDGSMRDYMASLDKLAARDDVILWPGHGGPVRNPRRFIKALAQHRRHREAAILRRLGEGDTRVDTLVARLYADLAPQLRGAAALSVLAHLDDLRERGLVAVDGPFGLRAHFAPA